MFEYSPPHPIPTMNRAIANSINLRENPSGDMNPGVIERTPPRSKRHEQTLKDVSRREKIQYEKPNKMTPATSPITMLACAANVG